MNVPGFAADALDLRNAILTRDGWDMAGRDDFGRLMHAVVEAFDPVKVDQLPPETQARLGVTATDREGEITVQFGRKTDATEENLGGPGAYSTFVENGPQALHMRIARIGARVASLVYYDIDVAESHEPGQDPLCEVSVDVQDRMGLRQQIVDMGEAGGSLVDMAIAMGIDPRTGEQVGEPVTSNADLQANLHEVLNHEEMDEAQLAELRAIEEATEGMQAIEAELGMDKPTSSEVIALAALARTLQTGMSC